MAVDKRKLLIPEKQRKGCQVRKVPPKPAEADTWAEDMAKADAEHEENKDRWPMFDWE